MQASSVFLGLRGFIEADIYVVRLRKEKTFWICKIIHRRNTVTVMLGNKIDRISLLKSSATKFQFNSQSRNDLLR